MLAAKLIVFASIPIGSVAAFSLLSCSVTLNAQVLQGSLTGTVTDSSGAVVPGAAVSVVSPSTGFKREGTTNGAGIYTFSDIQPGVYNVTVSAQGFGTFVQNATPILANSVARVNATLQVGAATQEVTVTEEATLLQTDRADTDYNISEQQLAELPTTGTTGRNFQSLYKLVPGAEPPSEQNSTTVNPQRSQTTNVNGVSNSAIGTRIDGALDQHPFLPANVAYVPPQDAIQTVNVVTSAFNAEQGDAGGAAINVILKSGTNSFHGGVFEYNTISQFNARGYFQTPANLPRIPKYIFNQYGGFIGGPIIKNKLFFFVDWESTHLSNAISGITSVPTAPLRNGDFTQTGTTIYNPMTGNASGQGKTAFSGNQVPVSAAAAILLKNLPLPNYGAAGAQQNNYFGSADSSLRRNDVDTKINYNVSDRTTVYGHYSVSPSNIYDPQMFGTNPGGNTWDGGQPGQGPGLIQMATLSGTHTFTPHLLLDANAGYTRLRLGAQSDDLALGDYGTQVLKIPGTNYNGSNLYGGIPAMNITGYAGLGNTQDANPFLFRDNQYTGNVNLSYTHGHHGLRFGGEYVHDAVNHFQPQQGDPRGKFNFTGGATAQGSSSPNNFNGFADFLLGTANSVSHGFAVTNPAALRWSIFGFYAQDTWEATHKLTMSIGARYEYYTVPTRDHSGLFRLDPSLLTSVTDSLGTHNEATVIIGGKGGNPNNAGIENGWGMIVPRLGLAYRINEKTVIRSGYGITVDPQNLINLVNVYPENVALTVNAPNSYTYAGTFATGIPSFALPDISSGKIPLPYNIGTNPIAKVFRRGYVESWNLAVQRQLPASLVVDIAYVGTQSVRQLSNVNSNPAPIGGGTAGRIENAKYGLHTNDTDLNEILPLNGASYNGLQTQLSRRSAKSISSGLVYTYSKAEDFFDNGVGSLMFAYPAYWPLNHALAGFDRTHNFQWWAIAPLPFGKDGQFLRTGIAGAILGGWQLQSILSWTSGNPFTVGASSTPINAPGNSQVADRVVSKTVIYGAHHRVGANIVYFEPTDYATPPATRFGNSGRNSLRGPGMFNLDAGVKRNFKFFDRYTFTLQAEAFGVTNTPQFGGPNATIGSSSFGTITGAGGSRRVRLSGRITF